MLTGNSSDSDSDGSDLAINVSKSKRIGRLLRRDQGGDSDEEQTATVTDATNLVEPFIPDLDNFLDPAMNEELVNINPSIDNLKDLFFPIEAEEMSNSVVTVQESKEAVNKKNKKRPEKRAPNSKKTLLEVKKMADTMVRSAPLAIDDAISRAPISDFNMSGFLQRFQATSEKRLELEKEARKRAAEEAAFNKPLSKAELKEKALADMAAQLREINS
ncbi:hypothetical protein DSO57_1003790 [Entomophthora muscae]|uniref:Uncharacterized protein n=1 Tax=Entomophthora muscae TaxID=34485 RepID=A0ACC2UHD1_9FUNG|nr:hypothetical protein DSO57_1003790 [Entomophthora muscae]